jgi:hypothetical protein
MMDYIKRKFWKHVLDALETIGHKPCQVSFYYNGGILFIPLKAHVTIALDLDGKGFVVNKNHPLGLSHNQPIYMPAEVLVKVRETYLHERGRTKHYNEAVRKHATK